jgi:Uncharacterized conserved protein
MTKEEIIHALLKDNIALATGCTEPVAVALCVAKAKEALQEEPQSVCLNISKNIIKNAMGVGIPGTGMIGLPIAVSLGIVCGESCKELDVLNTAKEHLQEAKAWLAMHRIDIKQATNITEKLYIDCLIKGKEHSARAVIARTHTNFVLVERDDKVLVQKQLEISSDNNIQTDLYKQITAKDVFEYATTCPMEELQMFAKIIEVNKAVSEEGQLKDYGLRVGRTLLANTDVSMRQRVIGKACAASDARMDGVTKAVYSNSGSGNQGITCTVPVYFYGKEKGCGQEQILRATCLASLMSIYIKQHIGALSALCGVVNASIGVGCGMVYLNGGSFCQVSYCIKNMINTITGLLCDGAKPSCALKISAGLNSAFDSCILAMNDIVVHETDGLCEQDVERCINNLGKIGFSGMDKVDDMVLDIMTHKEC